MTTTDRAAPSHDRRPADPHRRDRGAARRRRGSRLRSALFIALTLMVLGTVCVGWIQLRLNGNIRTFDGNGLSEDRPDAASSKGENVLVIGSDARNEGNSALGGGHTDDTGRSDTVLLVHIPADRRHAVAVSIPRDTLVTIPPCRLPGGEWTKTQTNAMFNAAFSVGQTKKGNPACTQNTVEKLTGLRVDHTVVVDFKGFAAVTDVVGGVRVCLPNDVYEKDLDPNLATQGELLFKKGEQTVSGQRALDYVRIRHGIGDGSDMGRIKRQQAFVAGLVKKVKSDGLTPARLLPLADAVTRSMTVDPGLGTAHKLISFLMSLKDIDLHDTKFVTVPWRYQGARVAIVQPAADRLWAALKADRPIEGLAADGGRETATTGSSPGSPSAADTVVAEGISVAVYNGTDASGLAATAAARLTERGFTVTGTANARSQDHATTVIQYGTGLESQARTVAGLFPGARLQSIGALGINVILGRSYAEHAPASGPAPVTGDIRSADDDPCSDLSYG
ncbi:LCP family protein [Streptomyces sp. NPDC001508]|uniref:LCP family protein n=1 Tax=Streptomyces sp. NPDC001508 TaxID=3154656 RepID=UPI003316E29B